MKSARHKDNIKIATLIGGGLIVGGGLVVEGGFVLFKVMENAKEIIKISEKLNGLKIKIGKEVKDSEVVIVNQIPTYKNQ